METIGSITPENSSIHFNDEMYYLKTGGWGGFHYTLQGVKEDVEFHLSANGVSYKKYKIRVVKVQFFHGGSEAEVRLQVDRLLLENVFL